MQRRPLWQRLRVQARANRLELRGRDQLFQRFGQAVLDERAAQVAGSYGTSASTVAVEEEVDLEQLRGSAPIETAVVQEKVTPAGPTSIREAHSSAELLELVTGTATDAPLCMTCGTKMRPAGSCYVCEGCGSTSGCS